MADKKILNLRKKIDQIDKKLLGTLGQRNNLVKKIGEYKKINNLKVVDDKREQELFKKHSAWAKQFDLDPVLVEKIFKQIIKSARKIQN